MNGESIIISSTLSLNVPSNMLKLVKISIDCIQWKSIIDEMDPDDSIHFIYLDPRGMVFDLNDFCSSLQTIFPSASIICLNTGNQCNPSLELPKKFSLKCPFAKNSTLSEMPTNHPKLPHTLTYLRDGQSENMSNCTLVSTSNDSTEQSYTKCPITRTVNTIKSLINDINGMNSVIEAIVRIDHENEDSLKSVEKTKCLKDIYLFVSP